MVAKAKVGCLAQPRSALRVQCPCLLVLLRLCPDDDVGHAALALAKLGSGHARLGGGGGVYRPDAPATEEAVKNFFVDVYENWVKTVMNPFFHAGNGDVVKSPVFRAKVAAAAKKYL